MVADAEAERAVVGVRHTSRVMPEMLDPKPQRVDRVHAEDYQQPIGERRLQDPIGRGSAKPRKCHAAAPAAPHFLANAIEVVHNREQLVERVKPARAPEQALAERGPVGIAHLVRTAVMQAMHHLIALGEERQQQESNRAVAYPVVYRTPEHVAVGALVHDQDEQPVDQHA